MQLFSVPKEDQPIIELLLLLQQSEALKERQCLIASMEQQGLKVDFVRESYEATTEAKKYVIPHRKCHKCGKVQLLSEYLSARDVEHPWCVRCRHGFPAEAERARATAAYQFEHGTLDLLSNHRCERCMKVMDIDRIRRGYKFCKECRYPPRYCEAGCGTLLQSNQSRFCDIHVQQKKQVNLIPCSNPRCPQGKQIPEGHKYCSRSCHVQHSMDTGRLKAISEKGIESLYLAKKVDGRVPDHDKRSAGVSANNKNAPPKRKMLRQAKVWGHEVICNPGGEGYVVELFGITATAKTMRQTLLNLKVAMRQQGVE